MLQTAGALGRVIGRPVRFVEVSIEQVRSFDPNLAKLAEWLNTHGFHTNIPTLRAVRPALLTFEAWLRQFGWEQATA